MNSLAKPIGILGTFSQRRACARALCARAIALLLVLPAAITPCRGGTLDAEVVHEGEPATNSARESSWVRPDVESYVNALPDSSEQKRALHQLSAALSGAFLADVSEAPSVDRAYQHIAESVLCLHSRYPTDLGVARSLEIERLTVNTPARQAAMQRFQAAIGAVSSIRPPTGCTTPTTAGNLTTN